MWLLHVLCDAAHPDFTVRLSVAVWAQLFTQLPASGGPASGSFTLTSVAPTNFGFVAMAEPSRASFGALLAGAGLPANTTASSGITSGSSSGGSVAAAQISVTECAAEIDAQCDEGTLTFRMVGALGSDGVNACWANAAR